MALKFGWRQGEVVESCWPWDDAFMGWTPAARPKPEDLAETRVLGTSPAGEGLTLLDLGGRGVVVPGPAVPVLTPLASVTVPDSAEWHEWSTRVPEGALASWREDGDGKHVLAYAAAGQRPTRITFRALTSDEAVAIKSMALSSLVEKTAAGLRLADDTDGVLRLQLRQIVACFRMGVDFPGMAVQLQDDKGDLHDRLVVEEGYRMVANGVLGGLQAAFPGLVEFFGRKVRDATFATEAEKKASSRPFTPTPSASGTASPPNGAQ